MLITQRDDKAEGYPKRIPEIANLIKSKELKIKMELIEIKKVGVNSANQN
jgi:hypothetical protein